jgi:cell division protein FtsB
MGKLIRFRRKSKRPADERARPLFPPFVGATDARPHRFPSDALPDLASQPVDPENERKRRLRRSWLIAAGLFVFAGGVAAALFGDRGYMDVRRQETKRRELQHAYDEHLKRVQELQNEIRRLKSDPAAIERIAREQLGYVAPGEITLLLPKDEKDEEQAFLDAKKGSAIVPENRTPQIAH